MLPLTARDHYAAARRATSGATRAGGGFDKRPGPPFQPWPAGLGAAPNRTRATLGRAGRFALLVGWRSSAESGRCPSHVPCWAVRRVSERIDEQDLHAMWREAWILPEARGGDLLLDAVRRHRAAIARTEQRAAEVRAENQRAAEALAVKQAAERADEAEHARRRAACPNCGRSWSVTPQGAEASHGQSEASGLSATFLDIALCPSCNGGTLIMEFGRRGALPTLQVPKRLTSRGRLRCLRACAHHCSRAGSRRG